MIGVNIYASQIVHHIFLFQLLEGNSKKKYYVFRSWGRVGTSIGGDKTEKFYSVESAVESFKEIYLDKTGRIFSMMIDECKIGLIHHVLTMFLNFNHTRCEY